MNGCMACRLVPNPTINNIRLRAVDAKEGKNIFTPAVRNKKIGLATEQSQYYLGALGEGDLLQNFKDRIPCTSMISVPVCRKVGIRNDENFRAGFYDRFRSLFKRDGVA